MVMKIYLIIAIAITGLLLMYTGIEWLEYKVKDRFAKFLESLDRILIKVVYVAIIVFALYNFKILICVESIIIKVMCLVFIFAVLFTIMEIHIEDGKLDVVIFKIAAFFWIMWIAIILFWIVFFGQCIEGNKETILEEQEKVIESTDTIDIPENVIFNINTEE